MSDILFRLVRIGNLFLSSANVIVAFSLLAYIASHNLRSPVARAFCALITFVLIVFAGDVILANVNSFAAASPWLRLQWLGIAFVPAAYMHFSDALLRTTGAVSPLRRAGVIGAYFLGAAFFVLAAATKLIVFDGVQSSILFHFRAGPLFWAFAVYYFAVTLSGVFNIQRARRRSLTSTSRRRMAYLALAFAAPGLGVFPYLLSATMSQRLSVVTVLSLNLVGSAAVALMTIVIGYIVAYQGVLVPDRVVKHSLIHYLLRGPLVAAAMIVLIMIIPSGVERIVGISRDTVLIFAIVLASVIFQIVISLAKPGIDRLIYRRDRAEITWIQELDKRLLTSTDLEQILENVLVAVCDLLREPAGFIITIQEDSLHLEASCGPRDLATSFLGCTHAGDLGALLQSSRQEPGLRASDLFSTERYVLLPLRSRDGKTTLGVLGIVGWQPGENPPPALLASVDELVHRAEAALDDIRLQQEVFGILRRMEPEIEQLQRWGSTPRYVRSEPGQVAADQPLALQSDGFVALVRDALSHYWGGPKLSHSPLLNLRVVQSALSANDGVPAKALRTILHQAIERLRPSSERSLAAHEWIVYNILDLKYLQGERIRNIASRLAMSESDFYRKQRIALEEVAKSLAAMEEDILRRPPPST
jgi:hypothetical protein